MVRTKADRVPGKAVGGKAPKSAKSTPVKKVTVTSSKGKNYSGGNPYHPRDTPEWQKPITCFLNQNSSVECIGPSTSQAIEDENKIEDTTGNESD